MHEKYKIDRQAEDWLTREDGLMDKNSPKTPGDMKFSSSTAPVDAAGINAAKIEKLKNKRVWTNLHRSQSHRVTKTLEKIIAEAQDAIETEAFVCAEFTATIKKADAKLADIV